MQSKEEAFRIYQKLIFRVQTYPFSLSLGIETIHPDGTLTSKAPTKKREELSLMRFFLSLLV